MGIWNRCTPDSAGRPHTCRAAVGGDDDQIRREVAGSFLARGPSDQAPAQFNVSGSGTANFAVPVSETEHLLSYFRARLGDGLIVGRKVRLHGIGLIFLALVLIGVAAASALAWNSGPGIVIGLGAIAALVMGVVVYDHMPAPLAVDRQAEGKSQSKRSVRSPTVSQCCAGLDVKTGVRGVALRAALLWQRCRRVSLSHRGRSPCDIGRRRPVVDHRTALGIAHSRLAWVVRRPPDRTANAGIRAGRR